MNRLRTIAIRALGALGLWANDTRLSEEFREHIELLTADYIREGMEPGRGPPTRTAQVRPGGDAHGRVP